MPQDNTCDRCSGKLVYGIQPCNVKAHGEACCQVHIGWRCSFCGAITESVKSAEKPGPRRKELRSTVGDK